MELRQLWHFVAIVEEGTFAAAAQRVRITQPALSRSVRTLEASLNTRLIERGLRGSIPTMAGELSLPHARAILADCERARATLERAVDPAAQTLLIGIAPALSSWFACTFDVALRRELPAARIGLKEASLPELKVLVRDGTLHCAISIMARHDEDPAIEVDSMYPLQSVAVCASATAGGRLGRHLPEILLGYRWTAIDGLDDQEALYGHSERLGIAGPCVTLTGSPGRLRSLVLEEGYFAVVPSQFLHEDVRSGSQQAVDLELPLPVRQVALLRRSTAAISPDIEAMRATVRRCLAAVDHSDVAPRVACPSTSRACHS